MAVKQKDQVGKGEGNNAEVQNIPEGVKLTDDSKAILKSITANQENALAVFTSENDVATATALANESGIKVKEVLNDLLAETYGIVVTIAGQSEAQREAIIKSIMYVDDAKKQKALAVEEQDKDNIAERDVEAAGWVIALVRAIYAKRHYDGKKASRQSISNYNRCLRLALYESITPGGFKVWLQDAHFRDDGSKGKGIQAAANRACDVLATEKKKTEKAEERSSKQNDDITKVADGGSPWKEPVSTVKKHGITKFALIPVVVKDGKLHFGFQHAELDPLLFKAFMAKAAAKVKAEEKAASDLGKAA